MPDVSPRDNLGNGFNPFLFFYFELIFTLFAVSPVQILILSLVDYLDLSGKLNSILFVSDQLTESIVPFCLCVYIDDDAIFGMVTLSV